MPGRLTRARDRAEQLLRDRIEPALHARTAPLAVTAWEAPGEPVPFAEAVRQDFAPFAAGTAWGRPWGTTWLHVAGAVPIDWALDERHRFEVVADLGFTLDRPGFQCEGLVHDAAGRLVKAVEPMNRAIPLDLAPGAAIDLWIEAASNADLFEAVPSPYSERASTSLPDLLYRFGGVAAAVLDVEVFDLARDLRVLIGLLDHLPADRPRAARIGAALEVALGRLDATDVAGTATAARAALQDVLASPAVPSAHRVVATGHAHIDSAWLWPTRETVRKCARTFSNVLDLMDRHPEFVFACSSAQQFQWIHDEYPDLFERILVRVREGRFVPVGGMWVESDTNMPSGESLARQFVEGGRVFRDLLGTTPEEVWLPDSFGYSAGLPQIAVAAGNRWMLTQKMSWNDTNPMPHHTFWWEGHDGSRIFTHFPPADTYVSDVSIRDLDLAERQFQDKAGSSASLLPFGWGNGGGGPTREMLADAARVADLEGAPRVRIAAPQAFFAEAEAEYGAAAPTWVGEMYLELHRGVFTTQARTKQGNRRSERLLHDAELWAATASVRTGAPYPAAELRALWRTVLLNQFHDVLPGSGIAWVHDDAEADHARVADAAEALIARSLAALGGDGEQELVAVGLAVDGPSGPAMSVVPASAPAAWVEARRDDDAWVLDDGVLRATVDADGLVASLVHEGRELLPAGERAAVPQLLADAPTRWDGWDLDLLDRATARSLTAASSVRRADVDGRPVLEVERAFGASRLVQRYGMTAGGGALEVDLEVDWQERAKALKLRFPFDVHADRFTTETQFGSVSRALHTNTSWDEARFEVCAHRYIRVDEGGWGVAVISADSYGLDATREHGPERPFAVIRPTLLRSPSYPDPDADRGRHRFRYRVVAGTVDETVRHAYDVGGTPRAMRGAGAVAPLVRAERGAVIVDTVKLAEDGSGDLVLRVYEPHGRRATDRVLLDLPATAAWGCDLHERPHRELPIVEGAISVEARPFSLHTIRISRTRDR